VEGPRRTSAERASATRTKPPEAKLCTITTIIAIIGTANVSMPTAGRDEDAGRVAPLGSRIGHALDSTLEPLH
jgi:hypothetical protein